MKFDESIVWVSDVLTANLGGLTVLLILKDWNWLLILCIFLIGFLFIRIGRYLLQLWVDAAIAVKYNPSRTSR